MRFVMFYHSLVSDWNHGNAHFLRGVVSELLGRGHDVVVYEPADGWSLRNLLAEHGHAGLAPFRRAWPHLRSLFYDKSLDLREALSGADAIIVHEWNEPELVARIGEIGASRGGAVVLFHDTHHRSASQPEEMAKYDLSNYDGALVFGRVVRDIYLRRGWSRRAWTWHEAADTPVFRPVPEQRKTHDLVWIGNWGDDERTSELHEYLIEPIRRLKLKAAVYGVRYPESAIRALRDAGVEYRGWAPSANVPEALAHARMTIHVPRRPYVERLPGVPTIRVFEALACGLPLVCSPWDDCEDLFSPGRDYLIARSGDQMAEFMCELIDHPGRARELADHGRVTVLDRHTCAHRVDELLRILRSLKPARRESGAGAREGVDANRLARAGAPVKEGDAA